MAALRNVLKFTLKNASNSKGNVSRFSVKNLSLATPCKTAYDSDGRTVVNVMNNDEDAPMMINSYSILGFRLNNGCFVIGPVAIFPHSILSWNIKDDYDINEKSLSLFLRMFPKLDVLIIGLSDARNQQLMMDTRKNIKDMLNNIKQGENMNIEVLTTEKAVTTFNFLNSEKRFVAAALVPPTFYTPSLDDEYRMDYFQRKKDKIEFFLP